MPFDSNGVFSRVMNWTQDQQNGITIECGRHDQEDDNFANGFNNCFCRDGRAAATGNFNLGSHKIQNLATGTATTDAVNKAQLDNVNSTLNGAMVKLSGNQTIAGTKTFSASPIVPTVANTDSSTKAATTAYVHNILAALYPVGSIYIGTQNSCPLATLIAGSTWTLVGQNRALWGGNGSNGNTTINAGLPNITGRYNHQCLMNWGGGTENGALYTANVSGDSAPQNGGGSDGGNSQTIAFDASKSNSIYGASTTVQPPAYRVNVWRRTA